MPSHDFRHKCVALDEESKWFLCPTCKESGDLAWACEHAVKNQYKVASYDDGNTVVEKPQNIKKQFRELPKEWAGLR